jgi:alcohol dehydrogenase class IV
MIERVIKALGVTTIELARAKITTLRAIAGMTGIESEALDSAAIARSAVGSGRLANNPRELSERDIAKLIDSLGESASDNTCGAS